MRRPKLGRPRLPRTRAGQRRLVQAVVAGSVLALLLATWTHMVTGDRLRTTADVPHTDVAVVFGAGLWDGEPSPCLAHRLDAAAELYRAGRIKVVLVTGDNSRKDIRRARRHAHVSDQARRARRAHRQRLRGLRHLGLLCPAERIFGVDEAVLKANALAAER